MTIYHIHHFVPRHAGGTNHPSNLVEVTIKEHAAYHCERWLYVGDEYDRIAWLGLSAQIGREEILEGLKKLGRTKGSIKNKKLFQTDAEHKAKALDHLEKARRKNKELFETDPEYRAKKLAGVTKGAVRSKELYETNPEHRAKKLAGSAKGAEKSRGSYWIYNAVLKVNKKIQKHETLPDGWIRGRKMPF